MHMMDQTQNVLVGHMAVFGISKEIKFAGCMGYSHTNVQSAISHDCEVMRLRV